MEKQIKNKRRTRREPSAREKVLVDGVKSIREQLISFNLEHEFVKTLIQEETEKGTTDEVLQALAGNLVQLEMQIEILSKKLAFYKMKKNDLFNSKIMKDYAEFPEKISEDQLVEVPVACENKETEEIK